MTNAEKFKEIFGYEPDQEICPFNENKCPYKELYSCGDCSYLEGLWWDTPYMKRQGENS